MRPASSIRLISYLLAMAHAAAAFEAVTEYDLKAAYLLNVLKFVERKPGPKAGEFVTLCLLAAGPIEKPLSALGSNLVRGRQLRVRPIGSAQEMQGCEVVFFGRTAGHRAAIEKANAQGSLTVGNDPEFVPLEGMLALLVENRRIVLEVNRNVVRGRDWTISSHLLEIARITGGGR